AKADGRLDTKNAFLKAWNMACASTTPATIYVPRGREGYDVKPLTPSNEASNIHDIGGNSNDVNKGTQVDDSWEKTSDNTLISFVDVINVDRNKTQGNFRIFTTLAFSECEVVIPRSYVEKELTYASIWVNLLDVQMMAFTIDGLSTIATKIGKPSMLDSFTSMMCNESWKQNSYARTMIEFTSNKHDRPVSKKNGATTSGTKNNTKTPSQEASCSNQFDTLRLIENDDVLSENRGSCMRVETDVAEGQNDDVDEGHKVTVVMPFAEDVLILSSSGGHAVENVTKTRNNKGMQNENVGQTPISSTVDPNLAGNETDVVVLLDSIRAISDWFVNTAYGFFLGKRVAYPIVVNCVRNTLDEYEFVKSMLNSSIRVKIHGVLVTAFNEDGLSTIATKLDTPLILDSYTSNMCVQSWGRSSYAKAMIKLRVDVELKDTIVVAMPKLVGEGFYIYILFVLSMSENFLVVRVARKLTLVNDEGKPLEKVEYSSHHDSEDEVEPVDNEMQSFQALKRLGYVTNSLLEQWRETYENVDYDYDPYDDDIYKGQKIPDNIQSICDNLNIKVRSCW
nr:hypothetical protein [Tanacetum cinerariifolium]